MIQVVYSLTQHDLYEAQIKHGGFSAKMMQGVGALLVSAGIISLAVKQYMLAIFPIVLGTSSFFHFRLLARSSFKKDFESQPEATAVVSDTGIEFSNAKGTNSLNWTAFVRWAETSGLFMLYVQSNIFNPIPKRALSAEDVSGLREILKKNVPQKKGTRDIRLIFVPVVVLISILVLALLFYGAHHLPS